MNFQKVQFIVIKLLMIKNITGLVIFLKPNLKVKDLQENKSDYITEKNYYKIKSEIEEERNNLIKKEKYY